VVSRHGSPDRIVLVKPFVHLQQVETSLLVVFKHADLHYMEEVGFREVGHDTGNMPKHGESSVAMARREFNIGCPGVGIAECSI
jgi:hypothetical protein